ncbi:MAG: putative membrane protein YfcA [bacterium]
MEINTILIFCIVGLLSGTLAGLMGIGGGIIYVPVILFYLEKIIPTQSTHIISVTTSLLIIVCSMLNGAYSHWKKDHIIVESMPFLAVGGIIGALLTSFLLVQIKSDSFKLILGTLQLFIGLRLIFQKKGENDESNQISESPQLFFIIGFVSGGISSFFGVGGGLITVPLLHWVARFPLTKAIGTSSGLIIVSASISLSSYIFQGWGNLQLPKGVWAYVYIPVFLSITPTAFFATKFGAILADKLDGSKLKKVFGAFVILVGLWSIARGYIEVTNGV